MTPEQAKQALEFLARITLKPVEIESFVNVTNALAKLAEPLLPKS